MNEQEKFAALAAEWEACQFVFDQEGGPQGQVAEQRQLQIEQEMDAMPFEFDEDGKVVSRAAT